ncbi:MAG: PQQ-binding-like beta-propeller repeat protein [Kofleriaceae bacterium]
MKLYRVALVLVVPSLAVAAPGDIVHDIPGPGFGAYGLGWSSDNHLWVANQKQGGQGGDNKVYELDPDTGFVVSSFAMPMGQGFSGIAFADDEMFVVDTFRTLRKLDKLGAEKDDFAAQGFTYGLARNPTTGELYEIEMTNKTIYRIDSSDGSVESSQASSVNEVTVLGHVWAGDSLWVVGSSAQIHRINPTTGDVIASLPVNPMISGPTGLAYDGACLWVSDVDSDRIFKIDHGQADMPACTHVSPVDAPPDAGVAPPHDATPDPQDPGTPGDPDDDKADGGGGCCSSSRSGATSSVALGLIAFAWIRRRRR